MSRRVEKVAPSVLQVNLSPSLTVCSCITNNNQINLSLVREDKVESRGQIHFEENIRLFATYRRLRH